MPVIAKGLFFMIVITNVIPLSFALISLFLTIPFESIAKRIQLLIKLFQPLESVLPPLLDLRVFFICKAINFEIRLHDMVQI